LIDGDRCSGVLELRNWRAGDSYQPAGTDASRKLKTLFQSRRIPSWERPEWPMVTCKGLIVWSRLFGVAQWAAAGPASQKVFRIGLRSVKPDAESGVA
jgi:tRNA(Ile)-lysidine synthetase-like protein